MSEMEWAPFNSLFLSTNHCTAKLTISITSDVSLWDRPCYENMLNYDSKNKCQKLTTIQK